MHAMLKLWRISLARHANTLTTWETLSSCSNTRRVIETCAARYSKYYSRHAIRNSVGASMVIKYFKKSLP